MARNKAILVRVTPAEHATVSAAAEDAKLSVNEYARRALLGRPSPDSPPRQPRPARPISKADSAGRRTP
jgi:hypothetical protein